jgi:hypothetical protein
MDKLYAYPVPRASITARVPWKEGQNGKILIASAIQRMTCRKTKSGSDLVCGATILEAP